jgi:LysM repeat protein
VRVPTSRTPASRRRWKAPFAAVTVAGLAVAGPLATNTHTVRPGETLSGIAADHGVSVRGLAEANGISDVHRVLAGARLALPPAGGGGGEADASPGGGSHTVRSGETLSGIAADYGVTVRSLAGANGITDANLVRSGQRLSLPASGGTGAAGSGVDTSRFPARLQASPERLALVPRFEHWARTYGIPTDLVMAMAWVESGWQNDVVSGAGAMGIGQLTPDTVAWMRDIVLREPLDPGIPDHNIRMSARYLRWLLDRTEGDPGTALAGYYQGLAAVQAFGPSPGTTVYVANVLAFRDRHF